MSRSSLIAAVAMITAICASGQSVGSLRGTVSDSTGAVMPGATIVCTNTQTGARLETVASSDGLFAFPELRIGIYNLEVSRDGFQKTLRKNIEILTGRTVEISVALQVGAVSDVVEVEGAAPLVQSATSAIQSSVTKRQMQELPLNGRNPLQLVVLTAGAVNSDTESAWRGQTDNVWVSVNGLRATQNNFTLDGANYTNRFFGTAPTLPNPDSLEEFTVQSSSLSAATSGPGAAIQLSTRSGTNQFHGSVFHFLRNTKLNARNFFQLSRPPFKLNQYGGTFGGPIRKDKTFFFYAFQGTRQRSSPSSVLLTTPTAAMRRGDFSAVSNPIIDPLTRAPFPGNRIPPERLDRLATQLVETFVPLPNRGEQYVSLQNRNIDDDQHTIKGDHAFSANNRMSVRAFIDRNNFQRATGSVFGFYGDNIFENSSYTLRDTHVFSPTLVASFTAAYSRFGRFQTPAAPVEKTIQDFGAQFPVSGTLGVFPGIFLFADPFFRLFSGAPLIQVPATWEFEGTMNKTLGRHQISIGASWSRDRVVGSAATFPTGNFQFNGQRTASPTIPGSGYGLADLLLGLPSSFTQGGVTRIDQRRPNFSAFVQDDFKISRRLTLNLGVRFEPWFPPIDMKTKIAAFVAGKQSTVAPFAPTGFLYGGDFGFPRSVIPKDWNNFAPRVGFAWDVNGNARTVVRAAYGLYYNVIPMVLTSRDAGNQPTAISVNILNPPSLVNPFANTPGGSPYPYPTPPESIYATYRYVLPTNMVGFDPTMRTPYTQSWNFTLERQFGTKIAASASYIGNLTVKGMMDRNINPAIFREGATLANIQQRRLYTNFIRITTYTNWVTANYHGLQLNLNMRSARGLTLSGNYTYSKSIDNISVATDTGANTGARNPFNLSLDRGVSDFDIKHRANFTAVYDLPRAVSQQSGWRYLLNDWQMNGIVTLASGIPFTVRSGTDRSLSGQGYDTSDIVGDPKRPAGVDKLNRYFNTAAFVPAAIGTYGTLGRNTLRGPGRANVDLSLFKNFKFTESVGLQFRAESFNIQNRANFDQPGTSIAATATYGKILGAADPRVFQFGLKLMF